MLLSSLPRCNSAIATCRFEMLCTILFNQVSVCSQSRVLRGCQSAVLRRPPRHLASSRQTHLRLPSQECARHGSRSAASP